MNFRYRHAESSGGLVRGTDGFATPLGS